jgi:hypothetical protein
MTSRYSARLLVYMGRRGSGGRRSCWLGRAEGVPEVDAVLVRVCEQLVGLVDLVVAGEGQAAVRERRDD